MPVFCVMGFGTTNTHEEFPLSQVFVTSLILIKKVKKYDAKRKRKEAMLFLRSGTLLILAR